MMKNLLKYILTFLCAFCILVGLFTMVNLIPQDLIYENSLASAKYFSQHQLFPYTVEDIPSSKIDNYADCILFNIIYCVDSGKPFSSAITADYRYMPNENVNYSYYRAVNYGKEPNAEYMRYWHGSSVFLRPMLTLLDAWQIKLVNAIVLAVLILTLSIILFRNKHLYTAVIFLAGLLCVSVWIVPWSIEYTTTFFVMLAVSIFAVTFEKRGDDRLFMLFVVSGALTCFVDFLTTETLTLLVPLMLVYLVRYDDKRIRDFKSELKFTVKSGMLWGLSYVFMFVGKWLLYSVVTGNNGFSEALASAAVRIDGAIVSGGKEISFFGMIFGAIQRNLRCLFFLSDSSSLASVIVILIVAVAVIVSVIFFFGKNKPPKAIMLPTLIISVIPYLRYAVLSNHSYLHYFFTFRAQLPAVMLVFALVYWCVSRRFTPVRDKSTRGGKRNAARKKKH